MLVAATVLTAWGALVANAQTPEQTKPNISNKALLVKPGATLQGRAAAGALHKLADDYYDWRNEQYPVRSSDAGLHTWDDRLTDYSPAKIAERAQHVRALLDQVNAMPTANWPKDERIDWILFRAQLESAAFDDRVWHSTSRDPQTYVSECSNGIFSLLKKEYDTPQKSRRCGDDTTSRDAGDARAGREESATASQALCRSSRSRPRARSTRFSTRVS